MKRETLSLALAAALSLSLLGSAALAAESPEPEAPQPAVEEYIPDPVGSITFGNLARRMHEGNLQIKALQESVDIIDEIDYDKLQNQLRYQLNEMAKNQWSLVLASDFMSDYEYHSAYDQLDKAYDAVRKQYDAIKDGDMQEDGLERQLAALDRQITELDLRYELGHISSMTLKQAKAGRAALASGLSTLRMNLNAYKGQLELLIGADITGKLSLGALPKVTKADLEGMDLEKDLEKAKENSWNIYQATETMQDELDTYNAHQGEAGANMPGIGDSDSYKQARHNWYSAKYNYDNTIQSFELGLRNLYLKVTDYKQVLDASRTALAVEQDNYAAAQLKQSQGTISKNALLEAGDKLKEAREKVAGAENDLFSAYNTYRWAVDYGIMN